MIGLPDELLSLDKSTLYELVDELPDRYQTVFKLRFKEEKTYREIGERIERTATTARDWLHKALRMIRRKIYNMEEAQRKAKQKKVTSARKRTINDAVRLTLELCKVLGIKAEIEDSFLYMPIEELELPTRTLHCLLAEGFETVYDIVTTTERDFLRKTNIGRKSLNEIKELLASKGFTLGMNSDYLNPPWRKDEQE